MKLSQHARTELLILASLALGSCAGPGLSEKQRDEVSSIASDEVGDSQAVSDLRSRVEAIESKLNM